MKRLHRILACGSWMYRSLEFAAPSRAPVAARMAASFAIPFIAPFAALLAISRDSVAFMWPTDNLVRRNEQGLTKAAKSTKISYMNCLDIRIALIISTIHRMVG